MSPRSIAFLTFVLGTWLPTSAAEPAEVPLHEIIDRSVLAAQRDAAVAPAPPATDAEFLRRVSLDLIGVVPTHAETVAFLNDADLQKRTKLIDRLLADPRFARHRADSWDLLLFGRNPPGYGTDKRDGFRTWLEGRFGDQAPYDVWVRELLRAEGTTAESGAMWYVQYKNAPEDATEAITQTFLGVQLQCARCHDHPYEPWTQLDFYGMAAFLARLDVVTVGKKGNETLFAVAERNGGDIRFTGPAKDARPGDAGEPVKPKFLHGDPLAEPPVPKDYKPEKFPANKPPPKPTFSRKDRLADWITRPDNPFFARAAVNRIWSQFLGRGLVHPVDDMSPSNEPTMPDLLDHLAREFVARRFDERWLIREIVTSKTYQASGSGTGEAMPQWYQHARSRPLTAEELIASWRVVTGYDESEAAGKKPTTDRYRPLGSGYLLSFFGNPTTGTGDFQGGLREHLYLNNGPLGQLIEAKGGLAEAVGNSKTPIADRVERLFLTTLNRPPTAAETEKFTAFLNDGGSPADAVWVLITSSEFRFNH